MLQAMAKRIGPTSHAQQGTNNHNYTDSEAMPERTVIFCLDMFAIGVVENDRADVKHLCISVRHQTVSNAELKP